MVVHISFFLSFFLILFPYVISCSFIHLFFLCSSSSVCFFNLSLFFTYFYSWRLHFPSLKKKKSVAITTKLDLTSFIFLSNVFHWKLPSFPCWESLLLMLDQTGEPIEWRLTQYLLLLSFTTATNIHLSVALRQVHQPIYSVCACMHFSIYLLARDTCLCLYTFIISSARAGWDTKSIF